MRIVLSGPQSQYKKAQGALESAGYKIVLNEQGDPDPSDHGFAPSAATQWSGATYAQADIDAIAEDNPDHGIQVGDVLRHTGQVIPVESSKPIQFIAVDGDGPDGAQQAVDELGWLLRAHFDLPEPDLAPPLTPVQKLARLGLTPADLKVLVGG